NDHVGTIEVKMRKSAPAVRSRMSVENCGLRIRCVFDVLSIRERRDESIDHPTFCRAGYGSAEISKRKFIRANPFKLLFQRIVDVRPLYGSSFRKRLRQPQAVIQAEQGRLSGRTQCSARNGMVRIAFKFDRTSVADFDEDAATRAASVASRSVVLRAACDGFFGLNDVRYCFLYRNTVASGQGSTGDCESCGAQKVSPRVALK